ncbi:hypothetical protein N0V82_003269 [Gnomoniopsis sp. IMI 355080]|nr:hypothetical protein N0V82_003269 [Gnomoniopsis sp. IMI 355080]
MAEVWPDIETLKSISKAREAIWERVKDRLRLKGYTNGREIISEFVQNFSEELVPVTELQSQLVHIMAMADDEELRTRFAGFLDAPLDSDSQKKAAMDELRSALLLPNGDFPQVMTKWLHAMRAASVQWSRDDPQKWEEYSTKLSHHMTSGDHNAENRRALVAMAEEAKVNDSLDAYFAELEKDGSPAAYMRALDLKYYRV